MWTLLLFVLGSSTTTPMECWREDNAYCSGEYSVHLETWDVEQCARRCDEMEDCLSFVMCTDPNWTSLPCRLSTTCTWNTKSDTYKFKGFYRTDNCPSTPEPTMVSAEPTMNPNPWYYLDHGSGTAVRCAAQCGYMECAANTAGNACRWGDFAEYSTPYQPIPSSVVGSDSAFLILCPGWAPNDASDGCEQLDCYCDAPVIDDFSGDLSSWESRNLGAGYENWFTTDGYVKQTANVHNGNWCQLGAIGAVLTHKTATTGSDFTLTADIRNTDDDGTGFVWCYENSDNYWMFRVQKDGRCKQIHKIVDGVWSNVVDVTGDFGCSTSEWCSYSVVASTEGITIYQNSEVFLETTQSCGGGKVGLYAWGNSAGRFDNFRLETGPYHPQTTTEEPTTTLEPTHTPTEEPSHTPTSTPSDTPTSAPSDTPTSAPSHRPTSAPSDTPTSTPSDTPTSAPSDRPTSAPSDRPTSAPSDTPTSLPSSNPTVAPSNRPTSTPTNGPTVTPSTIPTGEPTTSIPSQVPTLNPSFHPSSSPSVDPSTSPSTFPSVRPSLDPTVAPSNSPSTGPSQNPSFMPSSAPTMCNPICQRDFDTQMTDLHMVLEHKTMQLEEMNAHYELLRASLYHLCVHVEMVEPDFMDCAQLVGSLPTLG